MSRYSCLAAADPFPAQHADATDDDHEPDRPMDSDEEREFADQGPLTDVDMDSTYYGGRLRYSRANVEAQQSSNSVVSHTASRTRTYWTRPGGPADTQRDRGNGSRFYEMNIWMRCYGRGRSTGSD